MSTTMLARLKSWIALVLDSWKKFGVGPQGERCACGGTFTRRGAGGLAPWFYPEEKLEFIEHPLDNAKKGQLDFIG